MLRKIKSPCVARFLVVNLSGTNSVISSRRTDSNGRWRIKIPPQLADLFVLFAFAVSSSSLLTGCESLSARLARNQEVFHSLPANHQELIQQGNIEVGFKTVEVYLAWGAPSHKSITESVEGRYETWIYTIISSETRYRSERRYNPEIDSWIYSDRPYQIQREYVSKEAVIKNGWVDSFTIYPTTRPYY